MRAALAALALLAAVPAGAQARDRCNGDGVRTVALTSYLRVYDDEDVGTYWACLRLSGKRTRMFEYDLYSSGSVQAVAGRFVVFTFIQGPVCKLDCPPDARATARTRVLDARTRKRRLLAKGRVWDVELDASGAVTWQDAGGVHSLPSA
jgi:hypothetical protein